MNTAAGAGNTITFFAPPSSITVLGPQPATGANQGVSITGVQVSGAHVQFSRAPIIPVGNFAVLVNNADVVGAGDNIPTGTLLRRKVDANNPTGVIRLSDFRDAISGRTFAASPVADGRVGDIALAIAGAIATVKVDSSAIPSGVGTFLAAAFNELNIRLDRSLVGANPRDVKVLQDLVAVNNPSVDNFGPGKQRLSISVDRFNGAAIEKFARLYRDFFGDPTTGLPSDPAFVDVIGRDGRPANDAAWDKRIAEIKANTSSDANRALTNLAELINSVDEFGLTEVETNVIRQNIAINAKALLDSKSVISRVQFIKLVNAFLPEGRQLSSAGL